MTPAEASEQIVTLTLDTIEMAERVLALRNSGEESYSAEKPILLEVVSVANLIVNMSVAGMYKVPKEASSGAPSQSVIAGIVAALGPIIDSKIRMALAPKSIPLLPPMTGRAQPDAGAPPS